MVYIVLGSYDDDMESMKVNFSVGSIEDDVNSVASDKQEKPVTSQVKKPYFSPIIAVRSKTKGILKWFV